MCLRSFADLADLRSSRERKQTAATLAAKGIVRKWLANPIMTCVRIQSRRYFRHINKKQLKNSKHLQKRKTIKVKGRSMLGWKTIRLGIIIISGWILATKKGPKLGRGFSFALLCAFQAEKISRRQKSSSPNLGPLFSKTLRRCFFCASSHTLSRGIFRAIVFLLKPILRSLRSCIHQALQVPVAAFIF